jgi:hypothetical protein
MTQNELRYELISDKKQLAKYQTQILACFANCFGKSLDPAFWQWAYLENICGDPVVSLAFDQNRLAGHYAVIPIRLKMNEKILKTCLSMTTMVENDYRGRGLFVTQAKQVYDELRRLNYDLVVGYPNQNSAHGFKKHLAWQVEEPTECVIVATGDNILKSRDLKNQLQQNCISIDVTDDPFMQWRLAKPHANYIRQGETILKKFRDSYDIVYLGQDYENVLDKNQNYHLLIDKTMTDLTQYKQFDYGYGYRHFSDNPTELFFKKDLLISDVF